jgi:hypothetical protein
MPRLKRDTIEAMGLRAFLDKRYADKGGYTKFAEMIAQPDSEIARVFGTKEHPLHYQTVGNWRRAYLEQAK